MDRYRLMRLIAAVTFAYVGTFASAQGVSSSGSGAGSGKSRGSSATGQQSSGVQGAASAQGGGNAVPMGANNQQQGNQQQGNQQQVNQQQVNQQQVNQQQVNQQQPAEPAVAGQLPFSLTHRSYANFHGITRKPFFDEPGIRQQLNLTDDQFTQLKKAYFQAFQRLRQGANDLDQNLSEDERSQILQMLESKFDQEFQQSSNLIMTDPKVRSRFDQLSRQYQGLNAFKDPALRKQFNLTPIQHRQLTELSNRWQQQMQGSPRGGDENMESMQFHRAAQRTSFMNELNAILKPEQRAAWTQLTGQAYDFQSQTFFPQFSPEMENDPSGRPPASGAPQLGVSQGSQPAGPQLQSPQPQGAQPQGAQPQGAQPQGAQPQGAQPQGAQPQGAQPQ